jgi:hypothetical protein
MNETEKTKKPKREEFVHMRMSQEEAAAFNASALENGMTLSGWLRFVARKASGLNDGGK